MKLFARELVPLRDGFRHGRTDDAWCDALKRGLGIDASVGVAESAFDPADGSETLWPVEGLFDVEPSLVPADEARRDLEGREERQGSAIGHPHGADERLPALAHDGGKQAGARKHVSARVIHHAEVAAVVHVQIEVDVLGPDVHANTIFIERAKGRQRVKVLAKCESRNAAEVDEPGQKSAP